MNFIKKFTSSWVNATPFPVVLLKSDLGGVGDRVRCRAGSADALARAISKRSGMEDIVARFGAKASSMSMLISLSPVGDSG